MSGGAYGRRNSHREKENNEERGKRQRTEKKTEVEMEVSKVAKMPMHSRRIPDLGRDGWKLENTSNTVTQRCYALVNCDPG